MIRELAELASAATIPTIALAIGLITMAIAINHHTQEKARARRAANRQHRHINQRHGI